MSSDVTSIPSIELWLILTDEIAFMISRHQAFHFNNPRFLKDIAMLKMFSPHS